MLNCNPFDLLNACTHASKELGPQWEFVHFHFDDLFMISPMEKLWQVSVEYSELFDF